MKILYKQPENDNSSSLSRFDIQNCYFKKLYVERDRSSITKNTHHHTEFELHIVIDGCQKYEVGGKIHNLESGTFLIIYPNVSHKVIASTPNTHKISITFNKPTNDHINYFCGTLTEQLSDNIAFISKEALFKKEISTTLIENSILLIIVSIFRMSGIKENDKAHIQDENTTISLVKQYISDNIEMALSVTDVSEYCYLSAKQLTRIFKKSEGVSPGEFIIKRRIEKIETLLAEDSFSLKQISEMMNFKNEYYFNAFFKKYSGMPPGEYRKMLGK